MAAIAPEETGERYSSDHKIFTTDPSEWMQYIYKEVCVVTEAGTSYTGRVYTIDPVSQSIVLVSFDGDTVSRIRAVMGHSVQHVVVVDENTDKYKEALDSLFRTKDHVALSPDELSERKEKLRLWLLKNRIPVSVSGENSDVLMIADALSIQAPYNAESCQSTNEIILGRIQGLITSMPKDAHQW